MKRMEVGFDAMKKEKFRHRFPLITNSDLNYKEGRESEMIGLLGNKLGKTVQELLIIIIEL